MNHRLLQTLFFLSTLFFFGNGVANLLQSTQATTSDPLGWAGAFWVSASIATAGSWLAWHRGRSRTSLRMFLVAGVLISLVIPFFESTYGTILAVSMGPIYTMMTASMLASRPASGLASVALGIGTASVLTFRHLLRPMSAFSDPTELLFSVLGTGLAVLAMSLLANRMLASTQEARLQAENALADLQRNHEALRVSRDGALAASRAKASFLANMSHELRTPLNAILGYVELMEEEDELPRQAKNDLGHVSTAAHHLLSTITEILDLSRIEAGETIIELEYVDIQPLCDDVQTITRPLLRPQTNTLDTSIEADAWVTDGPRLRQVLLNLLSNANKFTERGTLSLRVQPEERSGRPGLAFYVRDTGTGISEERLKTIFEPFQTSGQGGSGIGLTVSLAIAEQLGGTLTATSAVGVGSTFVLWLPKRDLERT